MTRRTRGPDCSADQESKPVFTDERADRSSSPWGVDPVFPATVSTALVTLTQSAAKSPGFCSNTKPGHAPDHDKTSMEGLESMCNDGGAGEFNGASDDVGIVVGKDGLAYLLPILLAP